MDVYLLGAGFSSDAGVPTMKNFIDGVAHTAEAFLQTPAHRVLVSALEYARKEGSNNIEDLLAESVNDPVFFDLIWAFGLTVNHFSRQFLDRCRSGADVGWYDDFAEVVSSTGAHVLTFNYDLIIEEVLWWRLGCVEDYQIPFDQVENSPGRPDSPCTVPVHKLHGSVSWLWCLACRYTVNRSRHVLPAVYEDAPCPRCGSRLIPMLIPPTFRKAVELAHPLQNLWQLADALFKTADRFIVGGLSFGERDADFRERFVQGIGANRNVKEVIIVNRDMETCLAIGSYLPSHIDWDFIPGFPQFCKNRLVK